MKVFEMGSSIVFFMACNPFVLRYFKLKYIYFISGYVHGKNIENENQMLEDISPTTKSVRDSNSLLTEMSKLLLSDI